MYVCACARTCSVYGSGLGFSDEEFIGDAKKILGSRKCVYVCMCAHVWGVGFDVRTWVRASVRVCVHVCVCAHVRT